MLQLLYEQPWVSDTYETLVAAAGHNAAVQPDIMLDIMQHHPCGAMSLLQIRLFSTVIQSKLRQADNLTATRLL